MAGISQKISPDDVMPLLARNVYMQGYQNGKPTEFLILLDRYVHQARELQILAGTSSTIRVASCDDAGTLVQILGTGCGKVVVRKMSFWRPPIRKGHFLRLTQASLSLNSKRRSRKELPLPIRIPPPGFQCCLRKAIG